MRTQATQTDVNAALRNRHSSHIPLSPKSAKKVRPVVKVGDSAFFDITNSLTVGDCKIILGEHDCDPFFIAIKFYTGKFLIYHQKGD